MAEFAIEVKGLVKIYQKRNQAEIRAVDGISFHVQRGEIFGLLGPNGAGKTTTIKILTTLLAPTSGSARINGFDVLTQPLEVRKNLVVVMQENAVEQYLSVRDNFRVFGRFHGLSWKEIEVRAERLMEQFGLSEYRNQQPIDLSGGLKRRIQVAKVFMVDKPIVFLDEATTGMDAVNKRAAIQAVEEEARKGRTVVLTTHLLEEAEELCDSLIILNHGRIIASGSPEAVKSMGLRFYEINITCEFIADQTVNYLRGLEAPRLEITDNLIEVTVKQETSVMEILSQVSQHSPIRHFEVNGASLEDVFIQLLDHKEERL